MTPRSREPAGKGVLPAWVHLSEAAGLTRRSASRRPTPGREAAKSPCQHVDHKHQASGPGDYTANEITAAGTHSRHLLPPLTFARLPKTRRTT
jgi:hypothetical protein